MTTDRWTQMVRQQVGLGRILPLGTARDGAWITERAVGAALRRAAERNMPEVRLDEVRVGLADPDAALEPAVPAPPSALPPGPLRLTATFAATAAWPLPETASRLRTALAVAATERVGLDLTEVDLRVTELLDTEPAAERPGAPGKPGVLHEPGATDRPARTDTPGGTDTPGAAATPGMTDTPGGTDRPGMTDTPGAAARLGDTDTSGATDGPSDTDTPRAAGWPRGADTPGAEAVRAPGAGDALGAAGSPEAAPGSGAADAQASGVADAADGGGSEAERVAAAVLRVSGVSRLTGVWGRPVRLGERAPAAGDALPRRHARVHLAVAAGFRPLEVARAVRAAVTAALPDRPTVAVLVTDLD
ncbi:hypothetical protein AB0K66_15830 [Streptomyces werraensis]|uniref:hypothetical protein n=1 Tax=Streptomyces werraensis TaxID=68284 RepID=UPI003427BA73